MKRTRLSFRPTGTWPCAPVEHAIREVFPTLQVRPVGSADPNGGGAYEGPLRPYP